MATVRRASLVEILPVIRARVMSLTQLPKERVKLVARPSAKVPQTYDSEVLIRPGGFQVDSPDEGGAGRLVTILHRVLRVTCRTRLAVDPVENDEAFLLDPKDGLIQLEEAVIDSLSDFQPEDSKHNWLVSEPIHLADGPDPEREDEGSADAGYGLSVLDFVVSYMPPLDESYQ